MMDNVQNILPVIAALANDESREMYAKVIVQDVPKTPTIVIVNCWRGLKQSGSLRSQRMGFGRLPRYSPTT
mgnify:CR=1 FL=1